jgi:lysyl-tRNA synthetase class 1
MAVIGDDVHMDPDIEKRQVMDWAEELAADLQGPQVLNDSKTPSGTVHVGSLRGPVILDALRRALRTRRLPVTMLYGVDDLDPMDAQSLLSPDAVSHQMGRPLATVPDQVGDCHASYARHHAGAFLETFAGLGIRPDRIYWMSELYAAGELDRFIRLALDRTAEIRDIYNSFAGRRTSGQTRQRSPDWHPLGVICQECGRVGTTIVTDWDGERVRYECRPDLVDWAQGCGHVGLVNPFGGRAKLPWNLEWAAQWSLFGVTIEPCGKDLASAGGSRDRSDAIARAVFEREPPLNVPYEFLNIEGKKMAGSKGLGPAAHQVVEVIPPQLLRLLFLRSRPERAFDFAPQGSDAIPRLFDEFDRLAAATAGRETKGVLPPDPVHLFGQAALTLDPGALAASAAAFRLPFAQVAFLIQQPDADLGAIAAAEKGAPLSLDETSFLAERAGQARRWLDTYAPAEAIFAVRFDALPPEADALDAAQRRFLDSAADAVADSSSPTTGLISGNDWQTLIFETARAAGLAPAHAFAALYVAFLGRPSGPRAGWLLASLEHSFVLERLRAAAQAQAQAD